jgi:hypothetical protein
LLTDEVLCAPGGPGRVQVEDGPRIGAETEWTSANKKLTAA